MLSLSIQLDFSGEESLGSPPGLFSAVPYRYGKNYYIIYFSIHLEAVNVVFSFRKIVPEPSTLTISNFD